MKPVGKMTIDEFNDHLDFIESECDRFAVRSQFVFYGGMFIAVMLTIPILLGPEKVWDNRLGWWVRTYDGCRNVINFDSHVDYVCDGLTYRINNSNYSQPDGHDDPVSIHILEGQS